MLAHSQRVPGMPAVHDAEIQEGEIEYNRGQVWGSRTETKVWGSQTETKVWGSQTETKVWGSQTETKVAGAMGMPGRCDHARLPHSPRWCVLPPLQHGCLEPAIQ
eukprot:310204-Chlamydomonas_euryale.AAC.1